MLACRFYCKSLENYFCICYQFSFLLSRYIGHAQRGIHEYPFIFFKKRKRVKGQSLETKPDICKMLFRSCFLKIKRLRSIQKNVLLAYTLYVFFCKVSNDAAHKRIYNVVFLFSHYC